MEDLLLWRWSTTVQITSAVVLAVFMTAFGRSVGRVDTRWWMHAFQANLAAMAVTTLYWYGLPDGFPAPLVRATYVACKSLFVISLVVGVLVFRDPSKADALTPFRALSLAALTGLLAGLFADHISKVGMLQGGVVAVGLCLAAVQCFRQEGSGLTWLGIGLALRAVLGAGQAAAYAISAAPRSPEIDQWVGRALAAHSSFDTGAEWLIVLGCAVAVARRSEDDLRQSHAELHRANAALVDAVQRDALTGLSNRRALGPLLEVAGQQGATLLFFDLDGFKAINDHHGHDVGDACLKRFADALRERFPDVDGVVRYAGDEFIVVDAVNAADELAQRVNGLRASLACTTTGGPALEFSVGTHRFSGGITDVDAALREADQAMYRNKAERRSRGRAAND